MAQDDFIQSAFKELHLRSAEDAGGFHVSSMNECLDKARSLPPLLTVYPNVVLEGDLCVIFGQSLDKGSDAGSLMAALNALKKQHNWTLVILNHVPKMFSGAVPLSLSAIQGSAKINQLIDDAIGLGQSHKDPSMVYVKQCKWRNGEIALDSGNVALYERGKDASGNLCFTFKDYGCESDHLSTENTDERDSLKLRVRELSAQGKSQQEIAAECGISQSKVSRLLRQ